MPKKDTNDQTWLVGGSKIIDFPCGQYGLDLYIASPNELSQCFLEAKNLRVKIKLIDKGASFYKDGILKTDAFCVSSDPNKLKADPTGPSNTCIVKDNALSVKVVSFRPHKFFVNYGDAVFYRLSWYQDGIPVQLDPKVINGPPPKMYDYHGFLLIGLIWLLIFGYRIKLIYN